MSLLGTTEQRIVFSPVEVRNPAPPPPAPGSTSKSKRRGKESRKSKKKAIVGANGIEEVAGSLNPTDESGPATRSRTASKKDGVDDGDNDDMYATEDGDDEDGGDGTVGGDGDVGADTGADPPPRKKRKPTQNDKGKTVIRSIRISTAKATSASTTPTVAVELNVTQGQHQQGTPSSSSNVPMVIDPALEALRVPSDQPSPQAPGGSTDI